MASNIPENNTITKSYNEFALSLYTKLKSQSKRGTTELI